MATSTFGLRTLERPAFRRILIVALVAIVGTFRVRQTLGYLILLVALIRVSIGARRRQGGGIAEDKLPMAAAG
ncbi:MAG TPA: hypothetical protein VE011_01995 [Candidatus Dormibacteraeota bacterium]|nr:hypothetical protein [Candidatus Dormibacteraeota bacterium]